MQESWLAGEQRLCISMRIAANIWCIMNRAHGAKATANSAHRLRFGTHRSDEPEMPHCLSVGGRMVHEERNRGRMEQCTDDFSLPFWSALAWILARRGKAALGWDIVR